MRQEGRPDLVSVFERLIAEESGHLRNVTDWSERISGRPPQLSNMRWDLSPMFDDEGAGKIAPELLSGYRAYSMAVRNEERAFAFWTYVASRAPSDELRSAAEQMARDELGHIATLRSERRRAFHQQRDEHPEQQERRPLSGLEHRLAELVTASSMGYSGSDAAALTALAYAANERAKKAALSDSSPAVCSVPPEALGKATLLCELLLDHYLGLAETLRSEDARDQAQQAAGEVVQCLSALRRLPEATSA
jgi:rubrerythrin